MSDLNKMVERLCGISFEHAKVKQTAIDRLLGTAMPTWSFPTSSPSSPSPYDIRRNEHQELIAATLADGILAAQGGLTTTAEAVQMYRTMLVELRDFKEGNSGV